MPKPKPKPKQKKEWQSVQSNAKRQDAGSKAHRWKRRKPLKKIKEFKNDCTKETYVLLTRTSKSAPPSQLLKIKLKKPASRTQQKQALQEKTSPKISNKSQKEEHIFSSPKNQNHHSHHNYKNQLHNLLKTKKRLPRARRKTLTYRIYIYVCCVRIIINIIFRLEEEKKSSWSCMYSPLLLLLLLCSS
jgi:hypothetical protein